jgi:hypothetical protein
MTQAILSALVHKLEISPDEYKKAESIAADLAYHLANHQGIKARNPQLYIQGSFRLGTVVKPIDSTQKFDVDIVCVLAADSKSTITKKELKEEVGKALQSHPVLGYKFKPKPRCWSIEVDNVFKIDVVPGIPNLDSQNGGILIQDKDEVRWQETNPKAYFKWFDEKRKRLLVVKNNVKDAVDMTHLESERRMPLQIAVQILKRMRDIHFKDRPDLKPSSIVITTIAANSYNGEPDVLSALNSIICKMPTYESGEIDISYEGENFANGLSGEENKDRRNAFIGFLKNTKDLWLRLSQTEYLEDAKNYISLGFGADIAKSVIHDGDFGLKRRVIGNPQKVYLPQQDMLAKPWKSH